MEIFPVKPGGRKETRNIQPVQIGQEANVLEEAHEHGGIQDRTGVSRLLL